MKLKIFTVLLDANNSVSTSHANVVIAYKTVEPVVSRVDENFILW